MVSYENLKTIENYNLLALKVVVVIYKRFQIDSDLTWKLLVFWRGGRNRKFDCSSLQHADVSSFHYFTQNQGKQEMPASRPVVEGVYSWWYFHLERF